MNVKHKFEELFPCKTRQVLQLEGLLLLKGDLCSLTPGPQSELKPMVNQELIPKALARESLKSLFRGARSGGHRRRIDYWLFWRILLLTKQISHSSTYVKWEVTLQLVNERLLRKKKQIKLDVFRKTNSFDHAQNSSKSLSDFIYGYGESNSLAFRSFSFA